MTLTADPKIVEETLDALSHDHDLVTLYLNDDGWTLDVSNADEEAEDKELPEWVRELVRSALAEGFRVLGERDHHLREVSAKWGHPQRLRLTFMHPEHGTACLTIFESDREELITVGGAPATRQGLIAYLGPR